MNSYCSQVSYYSSPFTIPLMFPTPTGQSRSHDVEGPTVCCQGAVHCSKRSWNDWTMADDGWMMLERCLIIVNRDEWLEVVLDWFDNAASHYTWQWEWWMISICRPLTGNCPRTKSFCNFQLFKQQPGNAYSSQACCDSRWSILLRFHIHSTCSCSGSIWAMSWHKGSDSWRRCLHLSGHPEKLQQVLLTKRYRMPPRRADSWFANQNSAALGGNPRVGFRSVTIAPDVGKTEILKILISYKY